MGNYKSTHKNVDNTKEQRMYPQPNYQIKTRPPLTEGNTWKQNIQYRIRQEQLADEAMPIARRKCFDPTMEYLKCQQRQGLFWMVFNCQQQFYYAGECMEYEFYVQMDKKRRDMKRNPQKWWKRLYDENGEVGKQKQMIYGELGLWDSVKFTILGESAIEDQAYRYYKPEWFREAQKEMKKNKAQP